MSEYCFNCATKEKDCKCDSGVNGEYCNYCECSYYNHQCPNSFKMQFPRELMLMILKYKRQLFFLRKQRCLEKNLMLLEMKQNPVGDMEAVVDVEGKKFDWKFIWTWEEERNARFFEIMKFKDGKLLEVRNFPRWFLL